MALSTPSQTRTTELATQSEVLGERKSVRAASITRVFASPLTLETTALTNSRAKTKRPIVKQPETLSNISQLAKASSISDPFDAPLSSGTQISTFDNQAQTIAIPDNLTSPFFPNEKSVLFGENSVGSTTIPISDNQLSMAISVGCFISVIIIAVIVLAAKRKSKNLPAEVIEVPKYDGFNKETNHYNLFPMARFIKSNVVRSYRRFYPPVPLPTPIAPAFVNDDVKAESYENKNAHPSYSSKYSNEYSQYTTYKSQNSNDEEVSKTESIGRSQFTSWATLASKRLVPSPGQRNPPNNEKTRDSLEVPNLPDLEQPKFMNAGNNFTEQILVDIQELGSDNVLDSKYSKSTMDKKPKSEMNIVNKQPDDRNYSML